MSELYPEAIYGTRNGGTMTHKQRDGFGGMARRYAYNLGYADGWFDRGKSVMPVPAGWSNLTEAIKAGERIDWDALDGIEAKCVHAELGTLTYKLERNEKYIIDSASGWYKADFNGAWSSLLDGAWYGCQGWSLWVKGELPLRKLTADELAPGTGFSGSHPEVCEGEAVLCVVIEAGDLPKRVLYPGPTISRPASEVEVVEVYGVGTFQTPKGERMTPKAPPVRKPARLSKQGLEIGDAYIYPDMVGRDFTIKELENIKCLTITLFCSAVEVDEELIKDLEEETL